HGVTSCRSMVFMSANRGSPLCKPSPQAADGTLGNWPNNTSPCQPAGGTRLSLKMGTPAPVPTDSSIARLQHARGGAEGGSALLRCCARSAFRLFATPFFHSPPAMNDAPAFFE